MHHDRSIIFPKNLRIRSSLNLKNFYSFLLCIEAMVINYCFASVLQQLLYAVAYVASKLLTGAKYTILEYSSTDCTGTPKVDTGDLGSCLPGDGNYQYKFITATSGNTPVSTPVSSPFSTPSTVIVPSPISSPTTGALTGYAFRTQYLDDSCTTFASATIVPLNTCFTHYAPGVSPSYQKYSFTSTTFRVDTYIDDTCSSLIVTGTPITYSSACISRSKFYVQQSSDLPTTSATFSFRYGHNFNIDI
jgi:hypothetical protein